MNKKLTIGQKLDKLYWKYLNKTISKKQYDFTLKQEALIGEYELKKSVELLSNEELFAEIKRRESLNLLTGVEVKIHYKHEVPISEESYQDWDKGSSIDFENKDCSKCHKKIDYWKEGGAFHKITEELYCVPCAKLIKVEGK